MTTPCTNSLRNESNIIRSKPCGVSHAVTRGLHDADITRMHADGLTMREIGRRFGCARWVVGDRLAAIRAGEGGTRKLGRASHPVTQGQHDAEILLMRARGRNPLQIGMALKCSDGTIINRLAALRNAGEVHCGR